MIIRFLLAALLVLSVRHSYGYDSLKIALELHQSSQFQKALPIFIALENKFKKRNDLSNYALCQIKIADIIRNYGGVNVAIELLSTNEKLVLRLERPGIVLAQNYLAQAEALYTALRLSEFKEAILKSIAVKRQIRLPEKYLAEDYLHLARYYKELPNQNDSCYYWASKSLTLAKSDRSLAVYLLPGIYNLIGYYYHPASNAYFINKRDSLTQHYFLSRKYYDSARLSFNRQRVPSRIMEAKINHNLGNSYSNEAGLDMNMELLHRAIRYYRKTLSSYEELGSPSDMAVEDWVIGRAYERLKDYDSAILQFQKGIERLIPGFETANVNSVPPLRPTLNDSRFISLVTNKANNFFFKYNAQKGINDLRVAYNHYHFLLKFNHYLLSNTMHEQEATHWNYLYGANTYQQLVATAYELYKVTNDLRYLKASYGLLTSAKYAWLNRNDIKPVVSKSIKSAVLGDELKLVRKNILKSIPDLSETKLNAILPKMSTNVSVASLTEMNLVFQILDTISVNGVQHELSNRDEVLIDFYSWGNDLYSIIISDQKFSVLKQKTPLDFTAHIWNLKRNLLVNSPGKFSQVSNTIFKETLDSILNVLPKTVSRLIICPDANISSIPWDALVTDTLTTKTFKGLRYLLNQFAIRTVLSPRHLIAKSIEKSGFVGIAPNFRNAKRFSSIPFSTSLVEHKAEQWGGSFSTSLQNDSLDVNVLHIAAHMVNDSLRPYKSAIYFSDTDSLTIAELSDTNIHPMLAILNGCQSGNGTYYQSEGTISFARAFYRMGAESVLMTLWSVDDKTTADILSVFYNEMENGNTLDVSLHTAMKDFIQNAPTDELANPYYWAGLQLSGRAEPIRKPQYTLMIILGIGFATLMIFLLFIFRKKISPLVKHF